MGQERRDSGIVVPEQWGELSGAPGQGAGSGRGTGSSFPPGRRSSLPPARRSSLPPARRTDAPPLHVPAAGAVARPRTLGVISPFLDGSFWNPVLLGIHDSAQQRGFRTLVLRGTPFEVHAPSLAGEHVDGWIVLIELHGIEALARGRVPFITVGTRAADVACPAVIPDNHGGMRSAVRHLIEHGHRRIAFVGYFDAYDVRERFASYKDTLAEAGIAFDPDLVIRSDNNWYSGGQGAAPALLARLPGCTAAVFATDKNALGMMSQLKAAGVRVPEDLAIIGFDDIPDAESADPPLTTVRQRFEMMGSAACDLLASMIAGEAFPAEGVRTANALAVRSSCGCNTIQEFLDKEDAVPEEDAGGVLARQMVELLLLPQPLPPDLPPTEVWPAVTSLIDGYFAALRGAALPSATELGGACRQAVDITMDVGTLLATIRLLGQFHERRGASLDDTARRRVDAFLELVRLAIARARLEAESQYVRQLGVLARTNYDVSFALLGGTQQATRSLSWLETTTVVWGCLALWDDPQARSRLVVAGAYSRDGSPTPPIGRRCRPEAFLPAAMLPPSAEDGTHMVLLLPIRSARRDWGILVLVGPTLVAMAGDEGTVAIWGTLLGAALERDALVESLSSQHADLQRAYEIERALSETVRELGCPLIPLLPGVLLVPLIGMIDGGRARQVLEKVSEGVSRHRASSVLLDLTGVPFVDARVAETVGMTSRASALLGARVYLVGVRPEIAMSLVGVDLGVLSTFSSLSAALRELAPAGRRARKARRGAR
ncbi:MULTISPECIES: substrate-binding domain-containing protein [Sorangium]|uniref:Glucose-resistance amylase regulator n=1 Tax=Sorangium cellulosum (strain So ce56) TaxID=448385 RepID=A9G919_SORC5|nr:substrate-binding domain-containing protein [Sorangium cellulosum]CAN99104.1 Glucose-resistance amylase regulator [Sorangium cellulosum So ce56]